jgi:hypothetical protein
MAARPAVVGGADREGEKSFLDPEAAFSYKASAKAGDRLSSENFVKRAVSMRRAPIAIVVCALSSGAPGLAASSGVSVEPEALAHYSYCVNEAKDRSFVFVLSRQILYRCHGDVAVSYFNYLGHRRIRERRMEDETGVYLFRTISGVGRCWNKIYDEARLPVSAFGCEIYVDI